eukprot:TRINITY_DN32357_c0_g2_i1.p1 TRINITY_DN32357_c0_g2~~TRINITY_DN32357_c0_g2_i1.p1  ORF type:complete len:196 (-),score=-12.81 TRINITY_DN32357_c0_g2_i1:73-660(-)
MKQQINNRYTMLETQQEMAGQREAQGMLILLWCTRLFFWYILNVLVQSLQNFCSVFFMRYQLRVFHHGFQVNSFSLNCIMGILCKMCALMVFFFLFFVLSLMRVGRYNQEQLARLGSALVFFIRLLVTKFSKFFKKFYSIRILKFLSFYARLKVQKYLLKQTFKKPKIVILLLILCLQTIMFQNKYFYSVTPKFM